MIFDQEKMLEKMGEWMIPISRVNAACNATWVPEYYFYIKILSLLKPFSQKTAIGSLKTGRVCFLL